MCTTLFVLLTVVVMTEKRAGGDAVCNSSVYPVAMELGESGVISVDTHDLTGGVLHQACLLQLQGCSACYFDLHILGSNFAPCYFNHTDLPKYPECIPGCTSLIAYEPAYIDVTLRYFFEPNMTSSFSSLSSSLVLRFCENEGIEENTTYFSLRYHVKEKRLAYSSGRGASVGKVNESVLHVLESPNFPHGYARQGEVYHYVIEDGRSDGHIKVTFTDWDLAPSSRVEFYSEYNGSEALSIHFGSSARPVVVSPGPTLHLVFHADVGISIRANNMGFRAIAEFVRDRYTAEVPYTECGMYYKYVPGGSIDYAVAAHNSRITDCLWVIPKHSAFAWIRVWVDNFTFDDQLSYLEVRSGVISDAPIIANLSSSSITKQPKPLAYEGQAGFYIHLRGISSKKEHLLSISFVAFNRPLVDGRCRKMAEFECSRSAQCIDRHLVCDGRTHCQDASDEGELCKATHSHLNPKNKVCRRNEFACESGRRCIALTAVCDHWLDCPDGSDEYSCGEVLSDETAAILPVEDGAVQCSRSEQHACQSGDQCVELSQRCDGHYQCWDRSDELDCFLRSLQSDDVGGAPWNILMPVGIAVCVVVLLGLVTLCIRSHLKSQASSSTRHATYTSSRRQAAPHTRRPRRGRSVHSTASEMPLTLNLSCSNSHVTVSHLPESPPSYEEAMRTSPEGCSVSGFPSRNGARASPTVLVPPHYAEGSIHSPTTCHLTQSCFVFPPQNDTLASDETRHEADDNASTQEEDYADAENDDEHQYEDDIIDDDIVQPIYENLDTKEKDRVAANMCASHSACDDFVSAAYRNTGEPIYMNEDEMHEVAAAPVCAPLEFQLINGSLSQSRPCSHAGLCKLASAVSSNSLPPQSTLTHTSSPNSSIRRAEIGSATRKALSAPRPKPFSLDDNCYEPTRNNRRGFFRSKQLSLDDSSYEAMKVPYVIAPPPRTTSLIASILDRGANSTGKSSKASTVSPASTLSLERISISAKNKSLPIDSNFCDRIKRKSSSGSTGAINLRQNSQ